VAIQDVGGAGITANSNATVADAPLTAGAFTPPAVVEGQSFSNLTVFHFTDANPSATTADYKAAVTLGDGNSVTLTSTPGASGEIVANAAGGFDVQLSHIYSEELSGQTFAVQVTDSGSATCGASTGSFNVTDAALTAGSLTPPVATEEIAVFNVTVFHFTDADPAAAAGDYIGAAALGDGNTVTLTSTPSANGQIVAGAGGGFDVQLSYTYTEELRGATFGVRVTDHSATTSASTGSFSVADAPLAAGPFAAPTAVEGQPITNFVAFQFTDANPFATAADFTATVVWGDGTSSTLTASPGANGQVVASGGGFDVQVSHTYAEELAGKSFAITVSDQGGAGAVGGSTSTFGIADASLADLTGMDLQTVEGPAGGPLLLGTFRDPGGSEAVGDYTATIDWGDGSKGTGTIVYDSTQQHHLVIGTDGYSEEGTFAVTLTVQHDLLAPATLTLTAQVADAPLTVTPQPLRVIQGRPATNVTVATFTDPAGDGTSADYRADIRWGDSTVTPGILVPLSATTFAVLGSHTFAGHGALTISVHVWDTAGDSTNAAEQAIEVGQESFGSPSLLFPTPGVRSVVQVHETTGRVDVFPVSPAPRTRAVDSPTSSWGLLLFGTAGEISGMLLLEPEADDPDGGTALAGVPIALQREINGSFVTIQTAITNRAGEYSFGALSAGRFRVVPLLGPELALSGDADSSSTVTLGYRDGPLRVRIDFTVRRKQVSFDLHQLWADELVISQFAAATAPDIDLVFRDWSPGEPGHASVSEPTWLGGMALALALAGSAGRQGTKRESEVELARQS
jgi:hypothetical protein